jgi:hypothetical protein
VKAPMVEDKKATALRLLQELASEAKQMKGANLKAKLMPKAAPIDANPPVDDAPPGGPDADAPVGLDALLHGAPEGSPEEEAAESPADEAAEDDGSGMDAASKSDLEGLSDEKLQELLSHLKR